MLILSILCCLQGALEMVGAGAHVVVRPAHLVTTPAWVPRWPHSVGVREVHCSLCRSDLNSWSWSCGGPEWAFCCAERGYISWGPLSEVPNSLPRLLSAGSRSALDVFPSPTLTCSSRIFYYPSSTSRSRAHLTSSPLSYFRQRLHYTHRLLLFQHYITSIALFLPPLITRLSSNSPPIHIPLFTTSIAMSSAITTTPSEIIYRTPARRNTNTNSGSPPTKLGSYAQVLGPSNTPPQVIYATKPNALKRQGSEQAGTPVPIERRLAAGAPTVDAKARRFGRPTRMSTDGFESGTFSQRMSQAANADSQVSSGQTERPGPRGGRTFRLVNFPSSSRNLGS